MRFIQATSPAQFLLFLLLSVFTFSLPLMLTSCGANHYVITLRDGREFMTASKPELNRKTGYYKFRNLSDKDALIRADEVILINEL